MRLSFSMDRTILAFGLPSFCVQAGMAIVNFVINFQLVKYGALTPIGADDALAAIGVVQRIGQFSVMPLIGIAIALQPLLGFNYGAHNVNRVRKTLWYGIGAASSISVLMFIIVEVFAVPIAHAFGISHDGLVDFTAFAIRVQFLMLPFVLELLPGHGPAGQVGVPHLDAPDSVPRALAVPDACGAAAAVSAVHRIGRIVLRGTGG